MKRSVRCLVYYSFPVCISVCLALRLAPSGAESIARSCLILFCLFPNLSTMSGMPPPPPHVLFYSFAAAPGFAAQRGVAQIFQIFLPFPAVQISAAAADYDAPRLRSVSGVCETAEVDFPISGFAFCKFLSVALKVKLLLRCRVM